MTTRHHLIPSMLLVAAILVFATITVLSQQPTLTFTCDTADFIKALVHNSRYQGSSVPQSLREFRGLFIEENRIEELYPLAHSIFFDSGSAEVPHRYLLFTHFSQTQGFDETKIRGGTLQKYYHALNIIGARLRQHPDAAISIVGCNSGERRSGETRDISKQRAENVYYYLVNIWQIDPTRITILPPRNLPQNPSNPNDPLGDAENRRVEIIGSNWDINRVIYTREVRRFPQPETMQFNISNGVDDTEIARREIVITRNGKPWHVIKDIGTTTSTVEYNWGRDGNEDLIPEDQSPYTAQLVVYTVNGQKNVSGAVDIPVKTYTHEEKRTNHWTDKDIRRYSLILFPFDDSRLNKLNERILREYVYLELRNDARVNVTGYTDIIGTDQYNLKLSKQRADAVVSDMRKNVKQNLLASLDGKGVGEEAPLYSNELPEGRFYNRTVQIVVESQVIEDSY